jgi:photosystem II stability/assembly factor-like uncharacterized protein
MRSLLSIRNCRTSPCWTIPALLLGAVLLAVPAFAAGVSTPAAAGPAWSSLPIWGGDVWSLAIHPQDPDMVFAGTSAGQIYLSRDGGRTWVDAGPALPFPGWVVSSLRFDPNSDASDSSHPPRLWAALRGVWGGGHVASSDDLGRTWISRAREGLPNEPVYALALVPGHPGRIFAGTISGVYGTEDAGKTWRYLTPSLPEVQKVTSLLVDPGQPDTVIAGTWRRAYRSDDAGKSWAGVFEGMVLDSEVFTLTPIADKPGEIWASTCGWVYVTHDRGGKWERFKDGFEERRTTAFAALPNGRLLAGTVAGLHVSDDGGKTFRRVGDPGISILNIAYSPAKPQRIVIATEGAGVWTSDDGGTTLRPGSGGMINTRVGAFAVAGKELMVAVNHAGPFSGVYSSHDGGRSFDDFAFLPTVLDLAVYKGRVFAATENGLFERRGKGWHWVRDLGVGTVEQLIAEGPRLLARTPDALFEFNGKIFTRRPFQHGIPHSAAFYGNALWVTDAQGLYRLTANAADTNHTVPAPFPGGRLQPLEGQLLLWGSGGTYTRTGTDGDWTELTSESSRLLSTGDERFPAVMISGDTVRLFDREARKFQALAIPVPARDVAAARVIDGRLLLGTSGYGVLARDLPGPAALAEQTTR